MSTRLEGEIDAKLARSTPLRLLSSTLPLPKQLGDVLQQLNLPKPVKCRQVAERFRPRSMSPGSAWRRTTKSSRLVLEYRHVSLETQIDLTSILCPPSSGDRPAAHDLRSDGHSYWSSLVSEPEPAKTSRSAPNPGREIRAAFTAEPGHVLFLPLPTLLAEIELRLLGSFFGRSAARGSLQSSATTFG